jgi:hypothetical protein
VEELKKRYEKCSQLLKQEREKSQTLNRQLEALLEPTSSSSSASALSSTSSR